MATQDRPRFDAFDPIAWARERDRREGRFEDDLAAFRRARAETLAYLVTLPAGSAGRPGVSGPLRPLPLPQYVTHAADHDPGHPAPMRARPAAVPSPGWGSRA